MNALPDLPVSDSHNPEELRLVLAEEAKPLDLPTVFGNSREVELEIGIGKGRFMLLAASAQPERNFLGLEYARPYFEQSLARIAKRNLKNVRLAHVEAFSFIRDRLPDESLAACHIYFPDPWPKKRHHKRRTGRPEVLDQLQRVLKAGSLVRVASDHAEYAIVIRQVFTDHPGFRSVDFDAAHWEIPGMDEYTTHGVTNFEIKYRREGRPITRFIWQRI